MKKVVSFRQQCMIVPENHALLPKAYEEQADSDARQNTLAQVSVERNGQ
jgi:hypothetical protein